MCFTSPGCKGVPDRTDMSKHWNGCSMDWNSTQMNRSRDQEINVQVSCKLPRPCTFISIHNTLHYVATPFLLMYHTLMAGPKVIITSVLLYCFVSILFHLKLELLTQFPTSISRKYFYLWKKDNLQNELFDWLSISHDNIIEVSVIYFLLKLSWKQIYTILVVQGLTLKTLIYFV